MKRRLLSSGASFDLGTTDTEPKTKELRLIQTLIQWWQYTRITKTCRCRTQSCSVQTKSRLTDSKRIRKKRVERGGQEKHQATKDGICEIGEIDRDKDPLEPLDQGDVDLRRTSDLDDIDTAQGNRQFDMGTIENTGEENDNSIRRSSRKGKQPTRFANKVMVGLQCGYWRMRQGWLEFVGIGIFGFGMFGMGICGVGNFGETLKLEISMWKFEVGMLFGYHGGYIRCMSHTIICKDSIYLA
jgi:hypothetical protein